MPWINGEELAALEAAKQRLPELQQELRIAQAAGPIVTEVAAAIEQFSASGEVDDAAKQAALLFIGESERNRVVEERKIMLLSTKRDELAAEYRQKQGPSITQELDTQFASDGTYDRVRNETEASTREAIHREVLDAERARVTAELTTPEARQEVMDQLRPSIEISKEMNDFRISTRSDLEARWMDDVVTQVKAVVVAEVEAEEAGFKERYEREYREGPKVGALRRRTSDNLQNTWRGQTEEAVNQAVQDEELTRLLEERATLAKEKLTRENKAKKLLAAFEGGGIEVSSIEAGSSIVIELGEVTDTHPNGYSHGGSSKPYLQLGRSLTLHAVGGGRFRVRADSLKDSKSPWERSLAIGDGTIITIGNLQRENGEQSLEPRLCAGAHLHYDDDTTTPATFTGMAVPVANITIDGIPARELQRS